MNFVPLAMATAVHAPCKVIRSAPLSGNDLRKWLPSFHSDPFSPENVYTASGI